MIDALVADAVFARPGGLRASCDHLCLAVEAPERDAAQLLESEADQVVVFTVLEIEGDRISEPVLVGFASEERRELYRVLRSLPGIGRRSALNVLDCGDKLDILRAVSGSDRDFFRAVPGLGPKRIAAVIETLATHYEGALPEPLPIAVTDWVQLREALVAAGDSPAEAERRMWAEIDADGEDDPEALLARLLG